MIRENTITLVETTEVVFGVQTTDFSSLRNGNFI